MSSPNMIGNTPVWNYGKNASFGLWVSPLKGSKLLVVVYKGVILSRKTTFMWKAEITEKAAAEGASPEHEAKLTFKQKIEPKLSVVPASGAVVSKSDFPITLFASGATVVYSGDGMTEFKKMDAVSDETFYELKTGNAAGSFDLPELDKDVYETKAKVAKETQKGLLVPLWRIDVDVSAAGTLSVREVLNLHTDDTFAFEPYEEEPEKEPGAEDPCAPGDGGGEGEGGGEDGQGGGAGGEEGTEEAGEEDGEEPCPDDVPMD